VRWRWRKFWPKWAANSRLNDKDLHAAIGQYEFLRREYRGSKYRVEALFTIGQIYKEDLGDESAAKATFEEFLKRYPHNSLYPKAQEALAERTSPKPRKRRKRDQPRRLGPVHLQKRPIRRRKSQQQQR
jgi:N-acetylmuramoyl-L-alanine amidase